MVSAALSVLATLLEPHRSRTGGLALSLALPVLFLLFWGGSTWMMGGAARAMGAGGRSRDHLWVSGQTFPVLVAYALIAVGQATATRWAGSAGGLLSDVLGLLALPVLMWFVALSVLAAEAVYEVSMLAAIALALLPYAALSGALLVLILVVTVLRI
ncbi:MAG: hypothetical protein LC685_03535 [Actinobacteria bacterium]|nr:hypothetical protein [Actinomycetota bacterium]